MSGVHHCFLDHHLHDLNQTIVGGRWTEFVTGDEFTSLVADTTPTVGIDTNTQGGALKLFSDTTDNNEVAVYGTHELFKFSAQQSLSFSIKLKYTELTGNAANVAFGFTDLNSLANYIADDGANISASIGSGVCIYKMDTETVWRAHLECNGTTDSDISVQTAGGSSYKTYTIDIEPVDGSVDKVRATFHEDGLPLVDSRNRPIVLTVAYASSTVMRPFLYAKTGAAEGLTIYCKHLFAAQAD